MAGNERAAVRLSGETFDKLKSLRLVIGWVELRTHDERISHLLWLYGQMEEEARVAHGNLKR